MKNKLIIFTILVIFLYSCTGEPKESTQLGDFKVEFLFEKEGCNVYRFKDAGRLIYWSNCQGNIEYKTSNKNNTFRMNSSTSIKK